MDRLIIFLNSRLVQLVNDPGSISSDYLDVLYRIGQKKDYRYKGNLLSATITGVDEHGLLQLQDGEGNVIQCDVKEIEYL
jgi:hypothetical protein